MYLNDKKTDKYLYYWLITMFILVSSIIIVGGLTRLTDSGLSITEWELFTGFYHLYQILNGKIILVYINKYLNINFKILI